MINYRTISLQIPSLKDVPFPLSRTETSCDEFSSEELTALAFHNLTETLTSEVYKFYKKELTLLGYSLIGSKKFPFLTLADVHLEGS